MLRAQRAHLSISVALLALATSYAQTTPAAGNQPATGLQGGRGGGRGNSGRTDTPQANAEHPKMLFHERWNDLPLAQPITQEHLANQNLSLHVYGDAAGIRKTKHPTEDYLYTGETLTNWALTVSDKANIWDLSGLGKIRWKTKQSGYRFLHIVIKTVDGNYYVSEEGEGETSDWIETEHLFADLHWRTLIMAHNPSNVGKRKPDPDRPPIVASYVAKPDLSKVGEVGFSDLSPGGYIPSASRVSYFELYGKAIPRK